MSNTRRKKGLGTVIQIKGKFRARRRVSGVNQYGPPRKTKEEAERDRVLWKESRPDKRPSQIPRLADFSLHMLESDYGASLADATWRTHSDIHAQYLDGSQLGETRLDLITAQDYQRFIGGVSGGPWRVRRVHAFVSKLASLGVKYGYIRTRFTEGAILPKLTKKPLQLPSIESIAPVMDCTTWVDLLLALAYCTGMRRAELLRLEKRHLDFARMAIIVPGSKTSAAVRVIPLPDMLAPHLMALPEGFVFDRGDGVPYSARHASAEARKRIDELGVTIDKPIQGGRQVFATTAFEGGAHPTDVQVSLGHSSPLMALRHYAATNLDRQKAITKRLEKRLKKSHRVTG